MEKLTLAINLSNFAVTQYCNYNFNSFAKIGNNYIGASEDGLFVLGGDKDVEADINAFFELIVSDLGITNIKRIRAVYVGGEANGDLTLTVKDDEDNERSYPLRLTSNSKQSSVKVEIDRDGQGRYWQVRIDNTNGVYFAIDSIESLITILGKKPR